MNEVSTKVIRAFGLRSNVSAEDEVALLSGGERQSARPAARSSSITA